MSRKNLMFDRLTSAMCEQIAERFVGVMWDLRMGDTHQRAVNDLMAAMFDDVSDWTKVKVHRHAEEKQADGRQGRPQRLLSYEGRQVPLRQVARMGGISIRTLRNRLETMTPEAAVALGPLTKKAHG